MALRHRRQDWVVGELAGLNLGDPRRDRRAEMVAGRLAKFPEASLPSAMGNDAMLEGLYRHLSSPEISLDQLLRPHVEQTARRVSEAASAYAIHDTTSFIFGGKSRREGLGKVGSVKEQGYSLHATLAVSTDGERRPFGLLGVGTCARTEERAAKKVKGDLESKRWSLGIQVAQRHCSKGQLIHVADRESDIYPLLNEAVQKEWRFIFRGCYDRALLPFEEGDADHLFAAAAQAAPRLQVEVPLSPRSDQGRLPEQCRNFPAREGRIAKLCFSATRVRLRRSQYPTSRGLPRSIEVNVVRVWEPDPPTGEAPVQWILLTSESIETEAQVQAVVEGYRTRWVIEEFFKTLKTGCAYEQKQLESAHSLYNLLAYYLVIAFALLLMRTLARAKKDRPATDLFSPQQLRCLRLLVRDKLEKSPTVRQALFRVAALGGHLKNNGDPGWRILSRGWSKLLAAEEMYLLLHPETSDQS